MHYIIRYSCLSHIGNVRSINQDNFVCDGRCMDNEKASVEFPICGVKTSKKASTFGIFDGMGGEECGEIAAFIAAKSASNIEIGKDAISALSQLCRKANTDICDYAAVHGVSSMGTTAAILVFTKKEVALCNIGDSKIFRLCDGKLEQISRDHVAAAAFGVKPPLSQNLGIPPDELEIEPYLARGAYNDGDIYLICSDGLTDMVSADAISSVLNDNTIEDAITILLNKSLAAGGKDNTTIILCEIEGQPGWLFKRKHLTKRKEE